MPKNNQFEGYSCVEVRFSRTKSFYMDIVFVVGRQGRIVEEADTMTELYSLHVWLNEIVGGAEECIYKADREGAVDQVIFKRIGGKNSGKAQLIIKDAYEDDLIYVDAIIDPVALVWEIYS